MVPELDSGLHFLGVPLQASTTGLRDLTMCQPMPDVSLAKEDVRDASNHFHGPPS